MCPCRHRSGRIVHKCSQRCSSSWATCQLRCGVAVLWCWCVYVRFSVVKTYCGHGIGDLFHCAPNIPHYSHNKAVGIMKEGMVSGTQEQGRGGGGGSIWGGGKLQIDMPATTTVAQPIEGEPQLSVQK